MLRLALGDASAMFPVPDGARRTNFLLQAKTRAFLVIPVVHVSFLSFIMTLLIVFFVFADAPAPVLVVVLVDLAVGGALWAVAGAAYVLRDDNG